MTTLSEIRAQLKEYIETREKINADDSFRTRYFRDVPFSQKQITIQKDLLKKIDAAVDTARSQQNSPENEKKTELTLRKELKDAFQDAYKRSCQLFIGEEKRAVTNQFGEPLAKPHFTRDLNSDITKNSLYKQHIGKGFQSSVGKIGFTRPLNFNHYAGFKSSVVTLGIGTPGHTLLFNCKKAVEKCDLELNRNAPKNDLENKSVPRR